MRERVGLVRRRYGEQVLEEPARDILAAEYRHTTARGVIGAEVPDPQLHSRVVITGAVRDDARFMAVASRPVFRSMREMGAFYRCALAHELAALGYPVRSGTGKASGTSSSTACRRSCAKRFSGRSREQRAQPSGFVPCTAVLLNAGSCEH
jgi:TrwC relaxase